jgi:hypothetical protein
MYHYLPVIVKNPKPWKGRLPHEKSFATGIFLIYLFFFGLTVSVGPGFAQIYHVKDMNTE